MIALNAAVANAIEQLRVTFNDATLTLEDDGAGGVFVIIEPVPLGDRYTPTESWLGFYVSPAVPDADIYPLYLGGDVVRADGQPHTDSAIQHVEWRSRQALQLSRSSPRRDPNLDTPALKAVRVLAWFRSL